MEDEKEIKKAGKTAKKRKTEKPEKTERAPKVRRKKEVVEEAKVEVTVPTLETKPEMAVPESVVSTAPEVLPTKPKEKLPPGPRYYGTGRRKEAVAKVWLVPGSGNIIVNGRSLTDYFYNRKLLEYQVTRPLLVAQVHEKYDVMAEAFGGGVPGQAGALGLGIARALVQLNPDLRTVFRREGLLTRDPRMKERKKYGRKRARRSFQYTKR